MDSKSLFKLTYGLYLICAKENDKDNACIINTAVQIANNPDKISVSVTKGSLTCEMISSTGKFNISSISTDADFSLFEHFGMKSGRECDKFDSFTDVKRSENGLLYLTKYSNAFISVNVTQTVDLGSHILFIGEMTDGEVLSDKESCSYAYYHANIKPAPKISDKSVKGWRCTICGYEYEGEELPADYICPLCKHPASDFEKM